MGLPSISEIEELHRATAPSSDLLTTVFEHSQAVRDVARHLLDQVASLDVDWPLLEVGCLLHDIGVYRLFDASGSLVDKNYIKHGLLGHDFLAAEGLPEEVCRIASRHTGVGITRRDIVERDLPLPLADYVAETPTEKLAMYADKFHSKATPPCFNSFAWCTRTLRRLGKDKEDLLLQFAERFGIPDVASLAAQYGHRIRYP